MGSCRKSAYDIRWKWCIGMLTDLLRKLKKLGTYLALITSRAIRLKESRYKLALFDLNQLTLQAAEPSYEAEMRAMYERELKENNGYFIDVGANQGQTLLALLSVSASIPYLGIEPQPACAANIQDFLQQNLLSDHQILCACVSDGESITHLESNHSGDVRASIVSGYRPDDTFRFKTPTPTIAGDKLVKDLGLAKVQFIKIDVEGAELEVLRSFKKTLLEHKPKITFEILPDVLVSTGEHLPTGVLSVRRAREAALSEFLSSVDYSSTLLSRDGEKSGKIGPDPDGAVRNYIATPLN
ncbi:FkbM family methyltransferase [Candidatus Binatia bacterium]|nr:FkbM family methyltransferase [Candidatus Binatia bacterium]